MTAAVILAAGESSRLGQPKQNLVFNGQTLLESSVNAALQSNCDLVIVVLGANAGNIDVIKNVTAVYNKNWKEGIASSIRTAINEINKDSSIDKVIIMLCDQPFVDAILLNSLINKQIETGKSIVACKYDGAIGVPVLFDRTFFSELLLLRGQEGAREILKTHGNEVIMIPFEQGNIDIDTPDDFERLTKLYE